MRTEAVARTRPFPATFAVAGLAAASMAVLALLVVLPIAAPYPAVGAFLLGLLVMATLRRFDTAAAETPAVSSQLSSGADPARPDALKVLAVASHEIRTPLNGVLGMAGLLQRTALTPEQASYARAIETSGRAMLGLVDDVLDLAQVDAGRVVLQPAPVALAEEIEAVAELLAPRAAARGIELASFVDPRLPERVVVDMPRLRQVLFNLVGNGIKFTREGGVALELRLSDSPVDLGAIAVRFAVCDTGIGIVEADRERIFAEFEQGGSGPARGFGGLGLGLAIAARLVALMGGRIVVDSVPGAGSCFAFTLMLPIDAAAAVPPSLAGRRVLVLSHGLVEAPLMLRRLFAAGADVELVTQAGLERGLVEAAGAVDVLLVDAAAGDPLHLVARVRAISEVPAAVLLAPEERGHLAGWIAGGFDAYLLKPVRGASLLSVVGRLAGGERRVDDEAPRASGPPSAALRVLLCDDNEINRLLARSLLERLGHSVVAVGEGRGAVRRHAEALAAGRPFDLVLVDLHMPEMDGIEVACRIRAAEASAGTARARVLAVTADTTPETRRRAGVPESPFDGWLEKPLDPEALAAFTAAA